MIEAMANYGLQLRSTFWLFLGTAIVAARSGISMQQLEDLQTDRWRTGPWRFDCIKNVSDVAQCEQPCELQDPGH